MNEPVVVANLQSPVSNLPPRQKREKVDIDICKREGNIEGERERERERERTER